MVPYGAMGEEMADDYLVLALRDIVNYIDRNRLFMAWRTHISEAANRLEQEQTQIQKAAPELLEALSSVEWGSCQSDQDGRHVSACPCCNRINPNDTFARNFLKEFHGHKADCKLKNVLAKARGEATQ